MGYRIEKDFLGEKQVPDDAYYGVQTLRGKENFHITGMPMSREPYFVKAFGYVKKAAAHGESGPRRARSQDRRRDHPRLRPGDRGRHERPVRDGLHPGRRRHLDQHERQRGDRQPRPREPGPQEGRVPVRQSQRPRELRAVRRTTSIRPRSISALILRLESYMEALRQLQEAFFAKAREFDRVLKMGRTHLQDAVPMSLGAEFHGWGDDDRRGGAAHLAEVAAAPARDQPRRHRDRHDGDRRARLPRARDEAPRRHHRHRIHPGRGPDRGHLGHRRLRAAVRRAQAHLGQAHQDLQRPPHAGLGAALRVQRDQPAADAAGLVDHAGQGESGDPGSRQPDRLPRDRPRPHGDARGLRRAAAAQRHGAGDHLRAVHLDRHDGARGQQPRG